MWFIRISTLPNYLALLIGILNFRYFSKEFKFIFYFVLVGAFTEIFNEIYRAVGFKNTMPIGHFYFPVAFLFLGIFYYRILKNYLNPKYILAIITCYLVYCIMNILFIQGLFEFPNLTGSIGAMILFLFSLAYFNKIMTEAKIMKLAKEPLIWVNSAILVYYAGNFIYYILFNYLIEYSLEFAQGAVKLFLILNFLFYSTFAFIFWNAKNINKF